MSDDTTKTKHCTICGLELPLTPEYFYFKKTRGHIYPESCCKKCSIARTIKYLNTHERRLPHPGETRTCKKCGIEYPLTSEYFNQNLKATGRLAYYCKECERIYASQYYKNNSSRVKARVSEYHAKNREKINVKQREQWHSDPERRARRKIYEKKNKERLNERQNRYLREYRRTRRSVIQSITARREARKHSLPDAFTTDDWGRCLDYFHHTCAVCGRPQGFWHTLAADHWIALADPRPDNPGTVPWNIVPLCHGEDGCNNGKGNRNAEEWLRSRYSAKQTDAILARIADYFDWIRAAS